MGPSKKVLFRSFAKFFIMIKLYHVLLKVSLAIKGGRSGWLTLLPLGPELLQSTPLTRKAVHYKPVCPMMCRCLEHDKCSVFVPFLL